MVLFIVNIEPVTQIDCQKRIFIRHEMDRCVGLHVVVNIAFYEKTKRRRRLKELYLHDLPVNILIRRRRKLIAHSR